MQRPQPILSAEDSFQDKMLPTCTACFCGKWHMAFPLDFVTHGKSIWGKFIHAHKHLPGSPSYVKQPWTPCLGLRGEPDQKRPPPGRDSILRRLGDKQVSLVISGGLVLGRKNNQVAEVGDIV